MKNIALVFFLSLLVGQTYSQTSKSVTKTMKVDISKQLKEIKDRIGEHDLQLGHIYDET